MYVPLVGWLKIIQNLLKNRICCWTNELQLNCIRPRVATLSQPTKNYQRTGLCEATGRSRTVPISDKRGKILSLVADVSAMVICITKLYYWLINSLRRGWQSFSWGVGQILLSFLLLFTVLNNGRAKAILKWFKVFVYRNINIITVLVLKKKRKYSAEYSQYYSHFFLRPPRIGIVSQRSVFIYAVRCRLAWFFRLLSRRHGLHR